jgi:hypothetical protein
MFLQSSRLAAPQGSEQLTQSAAEFAALHHRTVHVDPSHTKEIDLLLVNPAAGLNSFMFAISLLHSAVCRSKGCAADDHPDKAISTGVSAINLWREGARREPGPFFTCTKTRGQDRSPI